MALVPHDVPAPHDHLDVVVGFDGSPHAHRALQWTLQHLRPSARVTAVAAFTDESIAGEALAPEPGLRKPPPGRHSSRASLSPSQISAGTHRSELAVLPGDPRSVLGAAGAGADLLVIGTRGHGVLEHLLLGSVASAMSHHPAIPTIVVP